MRGWFALLLGIGTYGCVAQTAGDASCDEAIAHLQACGDSEGADLLAQRCVPELAEPILSDGCEGAKALEDGELTTWSRPEVGALGSHSGLDDVGTCLGTLVAPNVVITAAHCFGFRDLEPTETPRYGFYFRRTAADKPTRFTVVEAKVFGTRQDDRDNDFALARLADSVPESIATPAEIAETTPSWYSTTKVTYFLKSKSACRRIGPDLVRVYLEAQWWRHPGTCHGDSGGPVFLGSAEERGPLLLVHSGALEAFYGNVPLWYYEADPVARRSELMEVIERWSTADPVVCSSAEQDTCGDTPGCIWASCTSACVAESAAPWCPEERECFVCGEHESEDQCLNRAVSNPPFRDEGVTYCERGWSFQCDNGTPIGVARSSSC